jgi:PKHD-type hydroxylase
MAAFSPQECVRIQDMAGRFELREAGTDTDSKGATVEYMRRNCQICWVKRSDTEWGWVFDRIHEAARAANQEHWGFDVNPPRTIQYTRYPRGGFYAAHFDNGSRATEHRKLSVTVQLSPPHEYFGGGLRLWSMNDQPIAPKAQGSVTIFPSYLRHVAKPVWWGTRCALVTFLDGKKRFR